jgi:hypothetical protein
MSSTKSDFPEIYTERGKQGLPPYEGAFQDSGKNSVLLKIHVKR